MQNEGVSTYHITIDDDKLGVRPEVLVGMYNSIDARARQLAPQDIRRELIVSQDGRIKNKFYIQVSNRMAPHFYNLQEQVISHLFADVKNVIS
ncbi:MAG: hypothetical protein AUJ08_05480 [Thaumarchaeota archaeon 13_1_40CM_3_50_5]|nr:MAG: hypothetical protein AUJ08_05480 [Thaumarchaeota archaeon 13_1_40CM_3_50_5]